MASGTKSKSRARASQDRYRRNAERLQRAGLLDKFNKRLKRDPKAVRAIIRYDDFLKGKVSAVKTKTPKEAREVATKFGFKKRGDVVLVPREKHERITINRKGEVVSRRPNPRDKTQTITRKLGEPVEAPKKGERIYYTIRERRRGLGKIKRTTFAKFDDLLEYLNAYEINWDDVAPYFETEYVSDRKAREYDTTIARERHLASRRSYRRRKRKGIHPARG